MGISGRKASKKNLFNIIKKHKISFSIINGENAADDGKGITKEIAEVFLKVLIVLQVTIFGIRMKQLVL